MNFKRNFLIIKYSKYILNLLLILWDFKIIIGFKKKNFKYKIYLNYNISGFPIFSKFYFFSKNKSNLVLNKIIINKKYLKLFIFVVVIFKKYLVSLKSFLMNNFSKAILFCKFY